MLKLFRKLFGFNTSSSPQGAKADGPTDAPVAPRPRPAPLPPQPKKDPPRTREDVRAFCEQFDFEEPELVFMMFRPAVVLKKEHCPQDEAPIGSSRFGGDPDLPEGVEWPTNRDGRLLTFIAQIRIEDFRELLHEDPDWPDSGVIVFFTENDSIRDGIMHKDEDYFWMCYYPEGTRLVRTARPEELDHQEPDHTLRYLDMETRLEHARLVVRDRFMMHPRIPDFEGYALSRNDIKRLGRLSDSCYEYEGFLNTGEPHILGGSSVEAQEGAMTGAVLAHGDYQMDTRLGEPWYSQESFRKAEANARDWRLVLQVGSDNDHNFGCDGGNIFFFAHKDDLRDGSLARCWAIVDGS